MRIDSSQRRLKQTREIWPAIPSSIEKAILKATKRSTHKRYQTGCVIASGGELISDGCSHSSSLRLASLESIHAEIHALARGRYENLHDSIAYICTISRKSGNFAFSAPCLTCAIALKSAGIEEVVFTTGDNSGDEIRWRKMEIDGQLHSLKVYPRRKK